MSRNRSAPLAERPDGAQESRAWAAPHENFSTITADGRTWHVTRRADSGPWINFHARIIDGDPLAGTYACPRLGVVRPYRQRAVQVGWHVDARRLGGFHLRAARAQCPELIEALESMVAGVNC